MLWREHNLFVKKKNKINKPLHSRGTRTWIEVLNSVQQLKPHSRNKGGFVSYQAPCNRKIYFIMKVILNLGHYGSS
jgi:hypothetical protein